MRRRTLAGVAELIAQVQEAVRENVHVVFVDQGYTGENAAEAARAEGVKLEVIKLPQAKHGFVLLPRRWVVERTFAWLGRFRRLARDYERLTTTLEGWQWLAALTLMLANFIGPSA
jgi:transposase